jgi:hypothetical protein
MVEASRTTGTTTGIWAIVIVMTLLLAFWLMAIVLADRSQARASGRSRLAGGTGPALGGAWAGGSVAGAQAPEIPEEGVHEPIVTADDAPGAEARGRHARDDQAAPQEDQEETPTRANIPAQPTAGRHARPGMPRQRSGEGDRAGRSYAGQATPDDEEQDR